MTANCIDCSHVWMEEKKKSNCSNMRKFLRQAGDLRPSVDTGLSIAETSLSLGVWGLRGSSVSINPSGVGCPPSERERRGDPLI